MTTRLEFIASISEAAKKASEATGMSYELILAQAAQETGWGKKVLPNSNNIFNIQADPSWHGSTVTVPGALEYDKNGNPYYAEKKFRVYSSTEESLIDRVKFLQENPRYSDLFKSDILGNFEKEADVLQKAGYATDPSYASNLSKVYNGPTMQGILKVLDSKAPDSSSAKSSLSSAINQSNGQTAEQNAKDWFSTFSDSLDSWTGSATSFMKDAAKDVVNFFSSPSESLSKIGGWISSAFTSGESEKIPDQSKIDNSLLDLDIRTDKLKGFSSNQNTTQTGNALGDGDWEVKMPLSIINGDNYKNVAPSGIVTDFFNPGRQEQSEYQSFVRDYTKDLGGLSKSIWNSSAAESIWNSTQLNVNLSNLTNNAIGARTFQNIDPVVLYQTKNLYSY